MRNLPFLSCLVESYGYNFIHLRFSALCCGCHRAFGSGQIKRTCSSHPQPELSVAPRPSLRTDPDVLVVFLVGQCRERQSVIDRLIPTTSFSHTYEVIHATLEPCHTVNPAVFSFPDQNSLPLFVSVRFGCKIVGIYETDHSGEPVEAAGLLELFFLFLLWGAL